jgi:hypothetical protein
MQKVSGSSRRTGAGLTSLLLAGVALSALTTPAEALNIVPTYTAGVTGAFQTAFGAVATRYDNLFTDPVTVNITVSAAGTGLGTSLTPLAGVFTYGQVRTALINDYAANPSAARTIAESAGGSIFTTTDPSTTGRYFISTAEEKSLGLLAGNNPASDGTFFYNGTLNYTLNHTAAPGAFDFQGVAEHEVSEIMGRISGLGGNIGDSGGFLPYDLFRYTGAGTRGITNTGGGNYFSIDNGTTNLHGYNNATANPGSDPQDWDASNPADSYNAFLSEDQATMITPVDIEALNVLGWDTPQQAVPVPKLSPFGSLVVLVASLLGFGVLRRRVDET